VQGKVSAEEFVKIWQQAESLAEVAEKTGLSIAGVGHRATFYRIRHDVRLKKFGPGPKVNWNAVQRAAHKYRKP
jgi:hypothetical protein